MASSLKPIRYAHTLQHTSHFIRHRYHSSKEVFHACNTQFKLTYHSSVWGQSGPNPPKVNFILSELDIPYEIVPLPITQVKSPEYTALNPNGRLPTIEDPNTGITLWETGAIIEYLVETYDTARKISFPPSQAAEFWQARQWLCFQISGQGPYYGQFVVFKKYHPERVVSAVERYAKEANRVSGVLEAWLGEQKGKFGDEGEGPWLVGTKKSFADMAFIPWQIIFGVFPAKEEFDQDEYPLVKEWLGKMMAGQKAKDVWHNAQQGDHQPKWEGFEKYL